MVSYHPPVSLPRPISYHKKMWFQGVSTPCGAVSSQGVTACLRFVGGCRCMEGRLIPGCTRIPSRCCWPHGSQPVSGQPLGLRFPHRAGRGLPGRSPCFRSRFIGVVDVSDSGVGMFRPRIKLTPRPSSNQRSANQCG